MTPEELFEKWVLAPSTWYDILMWGNQKKALLAGLNTPRWISVEERLPEVSIDDKSEFVNALEKDGEVEKALYNHKTKEWLIDWGGEEFSITVTHWQPLPEKITI